MIFWKIHLQQRKAGKPSIVQSRGPTATLVVAQWFLSFLGQFQTASVAGMPIYPIDSKTIKKNIYILNKQIKEIASILSDMVEVNVISCPVVQGIKRHIKVKLSDPGFDLFKTNSCHIIDFSNYICSQGQLQVLAASLKYWHICKSSRSNKL